MNKIQTIQNTYHDTLFYVSAPINKKESFYLTPSEYKVLHKLIHYGNTYQKITFQNKEIAHHIYLAESTVKDSIEALIRKGYITTKLEIYNNTGTYKSKRKISIEWAYIETIQSKGNESEVTVINAIEEVINEPIKMEIVESEPENEPIFEDGNEIERWELLTTSTLQKTQYSDVIFNLVGNRIVYIPQDKVEFWNSIQNKKGILSSLWKNNNQDSFDIKLDKAFEDEQQILLAKAI